jgi:prolyl-tRNA editing enzyme YbaK/EbsC (Cys-tRNA(Pro) deacylase)
MSPDAGLHPNAARVQAALAAAGSPAVVRQMGDSTRTAPEAAAALGVEVGQIGKSLVFMADGEPVVVVVRGIDRVDPGAVATQLGVQRVVRADADQARAATGYPIGGVNPVGLPEGVRVLVDRALGSYDVIWVAAGTPNACFPTSFDELVRIAGATSTEVRE